VDGYRDQAVGILGKDRTGRLAMIKATLRPQVKFGGEKSLTLEELAQMHDQAQHACFIANLVKTKVVVEAAEVATIPTMEPIHGRSGWTTKPAPVSWAMSPVCTRSLAGIGMA
jgi:hypothetical protein